MGFPVLAICEICFCGPTIIFAIIPIISCHQRVPITSTVCNLLSNGCWGACVYGLYAMSTETEFNYNQPEFISTITFIAAIVIFILFRFRFLNLSFCSDLDSIQYIPSMAANSFFDLYTLIDSITNLRANPPLLIIEGETFSSESYEKNQIQSPSWKGETVVPYGSWRDSSDTPLYLKKAYILNIHCFIEYQISQELHDLISNEKSRFDEENSDRDRVYHSRVVYASPGYAPHFYATTRGSVPGYVKFIKSPGGQTFREFMMFIGYHSLLECIWVMMLKEQSIILTKELSVENKQTWTPMGKRCVLDYHNIPTVV